MMRKLLTGIFLLLISFQHVNACQCQVLPVLSVQSAKNYDVIFVGEVIAVSPGTGGERGKAKFKITELFSGQAYTTIDVIYEDSRGGETCGLDLAPGQTWTIYGHWAEFGVAYADWCEHSRMKMDAGNPDYYSIDGRATYEEEIKFLNDSLGVQPFLDPDVHKDLSHKNIIPGATQAVVYLIAGFIGLAVIFWFVRRLFRRDAK